MIARSIIKAAILGCLAHSPALAQTSPTIVFGLELGKPISVPECARKRLSSGEFSQSLYDDNPTETCHEPAKPLRDAPWLRGAVTFPLAKTPLIMSGNTAFTLVINGKLEGLDLDTLGYGNTQAIIRELTAKFGKPTLVHADQALVSGISVPSTEAVWDLPNLYVRYRNIDTSVEYGSLRIETPALGSLRKGAERARSDARTPL